MWENRKKMSLTIPQSLTQPHCYPVSCELVLNLALANSHGITVTVKCDQKYLAIKNQSKELVVGLGMFDKKIIPRDTE